MEKTNISLEIAILQKVRVIETTISLSHENFQIDPRSIDRLIEKEKKIKISHQMANQKEEAKAKPFSLKDEIAIR